MLTAGRKMSPRSTHCLVAERGGRRQPTTMYTSPSSSGDPHAVPHPTEDTPPFRQRQGKRISGSFRMDMVTGRSCFFKNDDNLLGLTRSLSISSSPAHLVRSLCHVERIRHSRGGYDSMKNSNSLPPFSTGHLNNNEVRRDSADPGEQRLIRALAKAKIDECGHTDDKIYRRQGGAEVHRREWI